MNLYENIVVRAFYWFESKGFKDASYYVSTLLTFIATLIALDIFFVLKTLIPLNNVFLLVIPVIIFPLEKLSIKSIKKNYEERTKSNELQNSKFNGTVILSVFLGLLVMTLLTVRVTINYWK